MTDAEAQTKARGAQTLAAMLNEIADATVADETIAVTAFALAMAQRIARAAVSQQSCLTGAHAAAEQFGTFAMMEFCRGQ
jgi:hypothetical protein